MKYSFGKLLNKVGFHSTAAITFTVPIMEYGKRKGKRDRDTNLNISDCYRTINLDFNWENVSNKSNSLHKIKVMRQALDALEKVIKESNE